MPRHDPELPGRRVRRILGPAEAGLLPGYRSPDQPPGRDPDASGARSVEAVEPPGAPFRPAAPDRAGAGARMPGVAPATGFASASGRAEDGADGPSFWPGGPATGTGDPDGPGPGGLRAASARWGIQAGVTRSAGMAALLVLVVVAGLLLTDRGSGAAVPERLSAVAVGAGGGRLAGSVDQSGPTSGDAFGTGNPPIAQASPSGAAPALFVHVIGQVRHPGVVGLPAGARVADAVRGAGGATRRADLARLNLARRLSDGEQILVPRPGQRLPVGVTRGGGTGPSPAAGGSTAGAVLDLNTATEADLDTLPGVGPVIAARIVAWRGQHGRFTRVEDLGEVSGIGDATLRRLRPLVRV